jgi:hypothetical protein
MIINENEKNRIKSLYGLLTESAPPEESVLVANKNPFKYEEYKNARKFYSSNLKDGDLFFITKGTSGWKDGLTDYLSSKIKENFDNKTIRYKRLDDLSTDHIGVLRSEYFDTTGNRSKLVLSLKEENPGTQCINFFTLQLRDQSGKTIIGDIFFDSKEGFKYVSYYSQYQKKDITFKVEVQSNDSIKTKVYSFSNWNTIPDEFFEIRKIQRQKTDF